MNVKESIKPIDFHDLATKLALNSQELSGKSFDPDSFPIVKSAIFNIFHDALIIHQSVRGLVFNGWSSSGAILIRTLIDLTISVLAIVKSKNPSFAAFKYFNHNHKYILHGNDFSLEERRNLRNFVKTQISQLSLENQKYANDFLKESDRPYWFCGEWNKPTDVLKAFASSKVQEEYKRLSSASHGGFYGLKYFRDRSDDYDITQRLPIGKQAILVSASSSRKIIELVSIRSHFEDLGLESVCSELRNNFENIEGIKDEIQ